MAVPAGLALALVTDNMTEKFLVVDDHPMFLEAMKFAIETAFPGAFVAEASSIDAAQKALSGDKEFDLVLLDLSMPGTDGFDGLLELRTRYPKLPILIVSGLEDRQIIHQAMTYGAAGFMTKTVSKDDLAAAIESVMNGVICLPPGYEPPRDGATSQPQQELMDKLRSLTPQQQRVLRMLREGLLNKQIAFELQVGESTVKAHVSEILRKLNVASRTQAVIAATSIDFESIAAAGQGNDSGQ